MPAWWLEDRMPLTCQTGLASLTAWLLRHKQHVCSMRLQVDSLFENEAQEEQAQLACCLMACLGSQLRALHVHSAPLVVAAWAPAAFAGLRQLHLDSGCGELLVSSSLHGPDAADAPRAARQPNSLLGGHPPAGLNRAAALQRCHDSGAA